MLSSTENLRVETNPAYVPRMSFEFRSAPDMDKAGTSYTPTVQAKHALPPNTLPDAGLVFDTLLKARDVCFATVYYLLAI